MARVRRDDAVDALLDGIEDVEDLPLAGLALLARRAAFPGEDAARALLVLGGEHGPRLPSAADDLGVGERDDVPSDGVVVRVVVVADLELEAAVVAGGVQDAPHGREEPHDALVVVLVDPPHPDAALARSEAPRRRRVEGLAGVALDEAAPEAEGVARDAAAVAGLPRVQGVAVEEEAAAEEPLAGPRRRAEAEGRRRLAVPPLQGHVVAAEEDGDVREGLGVELVRVPADVAAGVRAAAAPVAAAGDRRAAPRGAVEGRRRRPRRVGGLVEARLGDASGELDPRPPHYRVVDLFEDDDAGAVGRVAKGRGRRGHDADDAGAPRRVAEVVVVRVGRRLPRRRRAAL